MPYLIGQCENNPVPVPDNGTGGNTGGGTGGGTVVNGSALNEIIPFTNVSSLSIQWNATRKSRFGDAGVFYVEILGGDNKYRQQPVEAVPDDIANTTKYTLDFGGPATGRVIIS